MKRRQKIFLCGEPKLVSEFGEVCHAADFDIFCKLNTPSSLPKFFKKTTTVSRTVLLAVELTNIDLEIKKKNLRWLDKALPPSTIILTSSITISATEQASWIKHPSRLIGISAFPTLTKEHLVEIAPTQFTERKYISSAQEFFISIGKEISVVQDRIGMVMPRILCQLINEAFFTLTENIASPADIDTAMKLGTGYPNGPVEWANRIGLPSVIAVLEQLHRDLGEDRYRIAPLLKQLSLSQSAVST